MISIVSSFIMLVEMSGTSLLTKNDQQNSFSLHFDTGTRVQRKSVLQPSMYYSQKSFQLTPNPFLISRIDYNPSVI